MADCMIANLAKNRSILQDCGDYDVYTELNGLRNYLTKQNPRRLFLPQHYHLVELHDYAPNATWILNIRPVQDWIRSVFKVPSHNFVKQFHNEIVFQNPQKAKEISTKGPRAFLRDFWLEHVQHVKEFVQQHPSHPLIIVNISNPEAGPQLAKDLGWTNLTKAEECWGKHNAKQHG